MVTAQFSRVFCVRTLLPFYLIDVASLGEKMGLNDLTLEKLISEINGYKEKMRAIHEDYGRASQDLQDRINVLGYNLNEHLKETKDQISNTPQRLLNLETKYVTGEVNDSEYRSQREEFKGLLQRNLQSIEEIRSMIDVLSHIETTPLQPGEYKQAFTNTPKPQTSQEWTRGASIQEKSSPIVIPHAPPTQSHWATSLRINPEPVVSDELQVGTATQSSSPSTAPPQTNGTSLPSTPSTNAASVTSSTPIEIPPTSSSAFGEGLIEAPSMAATGAPEDSLTTGPAQDVAEDVADALVVKVVDDIPTLDASSAVVSSETSQLQSTVPGTEAVPALQPSAGLAQPSLTLPSQFYKVVCPKCGADVPKPAKVWELKGGKSKKNVLIGLFQCQDCRVKFREALTREIL